MEVVEFRFADAWARGRHGPFRPVRAVVRLLESGRVSVDVWGAAEEAMAPLYLTLDPEDARTLANALLAVMGEARWKEGAP